MKYTGLASGAGWTLLAVSAHYSGMSIADKIIWVIPILIATLPQSIEWVHRARNSIWYWRALRREDSQEVLQGAKVLRQFPLVIPSIPILKLFGIKIDTISSQILANMKNVYLLTGRHGILSRESLSGRFQINTAIRQMETVV